MSLRNDVDHGSEFIVNDHGDIILLCLHAVKTFLYRNHLKFQITHIRFQDIYLLFQQADIFLQESNVIFEDSDVFLKPTDIRP